MFGNHYNVRSEAFSLTVEIVSAFRNEVLSDGAKPIIVLFPERDDIEVHRYRGTYKFKH